MPDGSTQEVAAGRRHIIRRPRLTRLLDECEARIILLVAPAGYGKTTLAREWLEAKNAVWVRPRPRAADVAATAASFAEAASARRSGAGEGLMARLRATAAPPASAKLLAELLAADLEDWPSDTWLVIEDYHHLTESLDAETFVEEFVRTTAINVLVTSRIRPNWATHRRLLYGELFELDTSSLAMNEDEARAVLAQRQEGAVPGLVALAEGWPAVIGLAALGRGERAPTEDIPRELYDFFAEELYLGLSEAARQDVAALAMAPTISDVVASNVLGARAQDTLREAVDAGFLTRRERSYEFHPLLREFMARRAPLSATAESLRKLVDLYLQQREWDDAFAVAVTAGDTFLAERVMEHALDDLLNGGRLETLSLWMEQAPAGLDPAVLELADAELAFRHARHERAFVLARRAATGLHEGHPLRARAFLCAAQSAYFSDHTAEGRMYSETAASLAQSRRERASAHWLRFTASTELEDVAVAGALEAFEETRTDDPDDVVRAACGHLIIDIRFGEDPQATRHAEGVRALVDRVADPIVKTSFFNAFGRSLGLRGIYDEGVAVLKAAEEVARQTRLDFALPHVVMAQAVLEVGRGRLTRAGELLRRAEQYATDAHTQGNWRLVRGRLLLASGRPREALALMAQFREDVRDRATLAELDAYGALAAAIAGDPNQARDLAARARATSRTVEPTVVANLVSGLVSNEASSGYLEEATQKAASAGHVDLLVLPLRSSPQLRDLVAALPVRSGVVEAALARSDPRGRPSPLGDLSRREREVLGLVAEGMSNREIASRLFISDVTVKVHVRHIFEKLGVRSRTEAAVVALDESPTRPH